MRIVVFALGLALLSMTAGCAGTSSDAPRVVKIELSETLKRFKTKTSFTDGVFAVEARREGGSPRTLTTAAHRQYEWATYNPPPPVPGFVNREWFLTENRHDGRTMLYAFVEWNDDDPADYLAVGWWLHFPHGVPNDDYEAAERGVFIDGPELDLSNPPDLPVGGTATYAGSTGGLYEYRYGSAWGELEGESQYVEFSAPIVLTTDFSEATVSGCIGCTGDVETDTLHLWPAVAWRGPAPDALPADYEILLGHAPLGPNGTFESTDIAVTHPERDVTRSGGVWAGQFSNVLDRDGNPRRVVGYGNVGFDEADGSSGSFESIFSALTPAAVTPQDSETPGTP
ncbi:MAG: hypothetical protein OXG51_04735 [Gammaproteobacteria bacterium]|nr:hypothetical protein [Gammaproteobacteria bacterium]